MAANDNPFCDSDFYLFNDYDPEYITYINDAGQRKHINIKNPQQYLSINDIQIVSKNIVNPSAFIIHTGASGYKLIIHKFSSGHSN